MPESSVATAPGRVIYLMGASGSGKDSLINYALEHFPGEPSFLVARRYVTRKGNHDCRHDLPVSVEEFSRLRQSGFFSLAWESYNCNYGIAREIEGFLARGLDVIINGSRRYLPTARQQYPELLAVLVRTTADRRRRRLRARRRDRPLELKERLASEDSHFPLPDQETENFHIISNNGPLHQAGDRFIALLQRT